MEIGKTRLDTELAKQRPSLIALTGGGGKTTLLFQLAEAFARQDCNVLAVTTTRMLRAAATAWLEVRIHDRLSEALKYGWPRGKALFAARPDPAGGDKLAGYPPEAVDAAFLSYRPDILLVEADGAAGRPLKAPAEHEPVIPAETTLALALAGLKSFRQPFSEATVFRGKNFTDATGLRPGAEITAEVYARLVLAGQAGFFKNVPKQARRRLFFNQADAAGGTDKVAEELAAGLKICRPVLEEFYVGSLREQGLDCLLCRI